MNTETKQPLYKVLNQERTQGNWSTKPNELSPTQIVLETDTNVIGQISLVDVATDKEAEANAKYTVLAVNNFDNLANSLINLLGCMGELKYENGSLADMAIIKAKAALANIS